MYSCCVRVCVWCVRLLIEASLVHVGWLFFSVSLPSANASWFANEMRITFTPCTLIVLQRSTQLLLVRIECNGDWYWSILNCVLLDKVHMCYTIFSYNSLCEINCNMMMFFWLPDATNRRCLCGEGFYFSEGKYFLATDVCQSIIEIIRVIIFRSFTCIPRLRSERFRTFYDMIIQACHMCQILYLSSNSSSVETKFVIARL